MWQSGVSASAAIAQQYVIEFTVMISHSGTNTRGKEHDGTHEKIPYIELIRVNRQLIRTLNYDASLDLQYCTTHSIEGTVLTLYKKKMVSTFLRIENNPSSPVAHLLIHMQCVTLYLRYTDLPIRVDSHLFSIQILIFAD